MGAIEEGGKLAGGFVDSLKAQPLSLALVVMNMALLVFFYIILMAVAAQREREINLLYTAEKEIRELLSKCLVPERERRSDYQIPLPTPRPRLEGEEQQPK